MTWEKTSKWATGPVGSSCYHKGGFLTPAEAAAAAATAGGFGQFVGDGWAPQIVVDADPVVLSVPPPVPLGGGPQASPSPGGGSSGGPYADQSGSDSDLGGDAARLHTYPCYPPR